ncbi:Crp/Fnr family transcriptional regulator [Sphingomonas oryzagri]
MADQRGLIDDRRLMEAVGIFRGLDTIALDHVSALARIETLAAGIGIFRQGDAADRAHALLSGGIRIRQTGSDGAQALMRVIAPGEMFGTVALFTDHLYPADAETAMDSRIASWSETDFLSLLGRYPGVAINIIHVVGERLAEAQDRIREMASLSAEQRIARALLRLAAQTGRTTADGAEIAIPLRRKDLAELAGTTLHTASRLLAHWQAEGIIAGRKKVMTLCAVERLRTAATNDRRS